MTKGGLPYSHCQCPPPSIGGATVVSYCNGEPSLHQRNQLLGSISLLTEVGNLTTWIFDRLADAENQGWLGHMTTK